MVNYLSTDDKKLAAGLVKSPNWEVCLTQLATFNSNLLEQVPVSQFGDLN